MKIKLFEFQRDSLHLLRDRLDAARGQASIDHPQAIVFSAPTGSGKTIVMCALFEAILATPDDQLDWPASWASQSEAVILWVSDMPALNEQTRMKIEATSDRLKVRQLVMLDTDFDAPVLAGGSIYFINTQKLSEAGLLTRIGNRRQHSIWETLSDTARSSTKSFYVVIDEAHRGMASAKAAKEAQSLMQRFLMGFKDVGLLPMPLVIGISATPKRFAQLLENDQLGRTVYKVGIPVEEVRKSGLLKDRVLIDHPQVATKAEMALVQEAARRWDSMTQLWATYCKEENEGVVWPILVIQIEDGTDKQLTKTNLPDVLTSIESAIGRPLREGEVAHALHDVGDLDVGGRRVRKVSPARIEGDKSIGVVLFKTSLSTGWDCPRAEVMMSFRRAEDHTYIAQLLGRMVRTPLARRIHREAALNDVHLFLPHFDSDGVESVIAALQDPTDSPPTAAGSSRDLVVLNRQKGFKRVFEVSEKLITYRVNAARAQSALRRYMAIARGLAIDNIDVDSVRSSKAQVVSWISDEIRAIKADAGFDALYKSISEVLVKQTAFENAGSAPGKVYSVSATDIDIDKQFEEAGRSLSHGLHMAYWLSQGSRDATEVKIELIIFSRQAGHTAAVEAKAEAEFDRLYHLYKVKIGQLPEHRYNYYERLRLATAKPVDVPWRLPSTIGYRRKPSERLWDRHIYVEEGGAFRADLGTWEADIISDELASKDAIAWLRNIDRQEWSLEIPYETGGKISPMFPDLILWRRTKDGIVVDIFEPHNSALGDSFEKAQGLAKFAEGHGRAFGRIQMIRMKKGGAGKGGYLRLDLNKLAVRKKVSLISSNPQLDALFLSDAE
jgi:type III restriction enzyme